MPVYEFRCQKCNKKFEKLCAIGETGENLKCPACGAGAPKKIISSFVARSVVGSANSSDSVSSSGSGSACSSCSSTNCSSCGR